MNKEQIQIEFFQNFTGKKKQIKNFTDAKNKNY